MATSIQDFNKLNPNYVGNRAAYIKPEDVAERQKYQTKKKSSKKGSGNQSWLSSIISELGGAGGATGGAAIGAALGAPIGGIGAIPGGILGGLVGGFAGGFGGRAVENQVRDKELRLGDALGEGLVSGALGAGSAAFQGARGAYAAGKAAGLGGGGLANTIKAGSGVIDDAILAAEKVGGKSAARQFGKTLIGSGAKTGKFVGQNVDNLATMSMDDLGYASQKGLQSFGNRQRASQRGISPLVREMSPTQSDSYNRVIDSVSKFGSGIGKEGQARNLDDATKALVNSYKKSPEGAKILSQQNVDKTAVKFLQGIQDDPVLRAATTKGINATKVQNMYDDLIKLGGKSNNELINFSTKVNKNYSKAAAGGNGGSVEAKIWEQLRRATKETIDDELLGRSTFNKQFATLKGATEQLGKTITKDSTQATDMTLGRLLSDVAGPTRDVIGRGAQQVGKVTKYTTPVARGAITRGLVNGGGEVQPIDAAQEELDMSNPENVMAYNQANAAPTMPMGGQEMGGVEQMQEPTEVDFRSALQQAQEILGNNATSAQYLAYAKQIMADSKPDKVAVKAQDAVASGGQALNIIDQLEQAYQQAGGGQGRIAGTLNTLGGRAGLSNEVNIYNDAKLGFLSNVARSLGEKGVITDYDIERIAKLFPSPSSNPQEASAKWGMIRTIISNGISKNQEAYGGNQYQPDQSDLASLIQEGAY